MRTYYQFADGSTEIYLERLEHRRRLESELRVLRRSVVRNAAGALACGALAVALLVRALWGA